EWKSDATKFLIPVRTASRPCSRTLAVRCFRRDGLSFRAVGNLLSQFKARAQFLRVAADSTAPEILEVTILSGNLDAMRERDILVIKGNRLSLDGSQPDEGIFLA
ncbi:MAG: hypothetical protein V4710_15745, partial [Verrucomicrobiota bacterium]